MAETTNRRTQATPSENVRIGPVSLITLIIVVCMAVMGVLAATTSHATSTISHRQAEATYNLYQNERAGQEFVAGIDDVLAGVRAQGGTASAGTAAVQNALDAICEQARAAANGTVDCVATVNGNTVSADFTCQNTRKLNVAVTIQADASCRIEQWKMTSVQQEPQSGGTLWAGA